VGENDYDCFNDLFKNQVQLNYAYLFLESAVCAILQIGIDSDW